MDTAARRQAPEEAAPAGNGGRPSDSGPLLRVAEYSVGFDTDTGPVTVVDGIDLEIAPGEVLALVGESGSGKSVFCRSLIGLAGPNAWVRGDASLAGIDLAKARGRVFNRLRGRTAAMIFQDPAAGLDPLQSVGAHLTATLRRHHRLGRRGARDRAVDLLTQVGLDNPDRRLTSYPHELSGGMSQRVMIALALAGDPALLIADEPTTALDVTLQGQVLDLLRGLVERRGMGLLLVTHDLGIVRRVADRVAILYAGRLAEIAPAAALFRTPRHRYTHALLGSRPDLRQPRAVRPIPGEVPSPWQRPEGCAFVPRCAWADAGCVVERQPLRLTGPVLAACRHPVKPGEVETPATPGGTDTTAPAARSPALGAQPVLDVEAARRSFRLGRGRLLRRAPILKAVDGVSLSVAPGATLGLVGESGSGKSTLGRLIMGMVSLDGGRIRIGDRTITARKSVDRRLLSRRVQMVFQNPMAALDPRLPIAVQVAEPMRVHRLYDGARRRELALAMLRAVGLPEAVDKARPAELSGGQAQRAVIARALVLAPQLLICDEATSALDVSVQAQVLDLLQRLQRERSLSLLFISHDLAVVRTLATDIAVMRQGQIVEQGPAAQIVEAPRHPYTQSLVAASAAPPDAALRGAA